eukprot:491147_1
MQQEIQLGGTINTDQKPIDEEETKQPSPSNATCSNLMSTTWNTYKLITWNLWCIPVSSPRCLSNPDRCSNYLYQLAEKQEWQKYNGIIVVALQELWSWPTGLFPPFLLKIMAYFEYIPYIGRWFAALFTIISMLLGVLPIFKCLPIKYNPKARFIHKMRKHLPFAMTNNDIPMFKFLCNGLVILCNKSPTKWGFVPYTNASCDDALANKGWLWCYFEAQKFILINTHMQASGAGYERLLQIKQLKTWLYENWESKELVHKCVVLGDFNVDMESHPQRVETYNNLQLNSNIETGNNNEEKNDIIIEVENKINKDINAELSGDPLTCLECKNNIKKSLADNMRKVKLSKEKVYKKRKVKITKKAYINIPHYLGPTYRKLNKYESTFKRAQYNIDHIFANFKCDKVVNDLLALGRYKLSDHQGGHKWE